jgi:4a-hydroxytetrahydrobiopterin dehydratase
MQIQASLAEQKCVPCAAGTPPLHKVEVERYLNELSEDWEVENFMKIKRKFLFQNFKQAMEFVNNIAAIAEEQHHHPDMHIFYNKVTIELWTHAIGGLSENDFIMAAKIDKLLKIRNKV